MPNKTAVSSVLKLGHRGKKGLDAVEFVAFGCTDGPVYRCMVASYFFLLMNRRSLSLIDDDQIRTI